MLGGKIKYDHEFMSAKRIGKYGYKDSEIRILARKLKSINQELKEKQDSPELSFRKLPFDKKTLKQVQGLSKQLVRNYENMLVVGIGGSDLGARAVYQALAGDYANQLSSKRKLKIYFTGDTTDPQPLTDLLKVIDLKKTIIYVISKSGSTTETMATFLFLRKKLIKKVGRKKHARQILVTTGQGSILDKIAEEEDYQVLEHYPGGGRYSVLSVHGLFPAACAGFDMERLLAGAKVIERMTKKNSQKVNQPYLFACLQYLAFTKRKQNISVIMPYNYYLNEFGFWFRQLWAESLANKKDFKNKIVNAGMTPVASLGPTDQHSQIQLYNEGPFDKVITFLLVDNINNNLKVPKYNNDDLNYLNNHKFADILKIEHRATSVSLMKNKRANGTIHLPKLNEYYLGQLFYFYEMATVYITQLLGVNAFDQPGVEQSKNYMYGILGRSGYEKYKDEINKI
jgi:glucose-6-phosphate isomerase